MEIVRKKPIIKTAVVVIVLLCIALAAYIFYPRPEEPAFTGSGKIDIGGYSLFIKSTGEGKPTVVFDSGYGMTHTQWYSVLKLIENQTNTVTYSRAGIGGSDKSPLDRTCGTKAEELHKLLLAAKIKGPYILVGHSLGGFDVRLFATKYPEDVAGIILVDSSQEDLEDRVLKNMTEDEKKTYLEKQKDQAQYFTSPDGSSDDIEESCKQVRETRNTLKDIPMTVIVAQEGIDDTRDGRKGVWLELQKDLASLSTKSKLIIAKNSGHNIPGDEPEVVADAILEMLSTARK
jgi:pimeloyl-ACP methyl ester carboxylesterase